MARCFKRVASGWIAAGVSIAFFLGPPAWAGQVIPVLPEIRFRRNDRILVLAPHPDDEVLGCAGVIQKAVQMKLPLRVVFLTYGDNNEFSFLLYLKHPVLMPKAVRRMGDLRHAEALTAAEILDLSPAQLTFLGYPDWGTLRIWNSHWAGRPAYRSMLTRTKTVPYPDALRLGASYKGEEVLKDLETILREFRPTKVFVSHPADSHPDHQALYLFSRVALWDSQPKVRAELYPYLVHFWKWPRPNGTPTAEPMIPPMPLNQADWRTVPLSPEELERKGAALRAHRSQFGSGPKSMASLVCPNELFGDFPDLSLDRRGDGHSSIEERSEAGQAPEGLTDEQKTGFVGIEQRVVRVEGDDLVLSIDFSRPFARGVKASITIFGYRSDRPFGQMPKLHVHLGMLHATIYDQNRKIAADGIQMVRHPRQIILRIPLKVLGDPQKILTAAHTSMGSLPLDRVSWRVIELSSGV